jgi:hypothetical protein
MRHHPELTLQNAPLTAGRPLHLSSAPLDPRQLPAPETGRALTCGRSAERRGLAVLRHRTPARPEPRRRLLRRRQPPPRYYRADTRRLLASELPASPTVPDLDLEILE